MEATEGPDAADTCACCSKPATKMKNWYDPFSYQSIVNFAGQLTALHVSLKQDRIQETILQEREGEIYACLAIKNSFSEMSNMNLLSSWRSEMRASMLVQRS